MSSGLSCPGCNKTFETTAGLSTHKRKCKPLQLKAVQVLRRFKERKDGEPAHNVGKRARIEDENLEEAGPSN
ncbi:hypothetical protein C0992_010510 [Termitomyces sp. T32_za158]|nr:hypothetical protein C0992_010510 [Termitomyces sp. T32_za158]